MLTITNSTISGNKADKLGGGGIGNGGTLTILKSTISYNAAVTAGGAIENGDTLSLENSTIAYNTTSVYGGGLAFGDGGQASITASTIYGNMTGVEGGNIHTHGVPVKLRATIIRGLNQTNLVAAVVHDQIIELYVNHQRVAVVSVVVGGRALTHGEIGVIVTPSGHQTEVIFQNAKVWTV